MVLAPGTRLGPYEIQSAIGAGGMGEVYRARDTRLDRSVAIKILPTQVTEAPDRLRRFTQEARAASALNHPNIAHIYELDEADGLSFIAMEYVEGQTLAAKVSGGPLDASEVADIALQVADALDEARSKGVTHRDIKPANLMLTPRGQVKVLDFGLAKVTRAEGPSAAGGVNSGPVTSPGLVMGTVEYMSPEQVLGRELDHRTDLFSLGVVMYEMAAGRQPFSGATATEVMDRILHAQPDTIARFNASVPAELEHIIRKCLEKDRQRRYQSARELSTDLQHIDRDLLTVAVAAPKSGTRTSDDKNRLRAALGGDTPAAGAGHVHERLRSPGELQNALGSTPETAPTSTQATELDLPPVLTRLQWSDLIVLASGAIGGIVFLAMAEHIFPARTLQLGIDRSLAVRLAQDYARAFDAPAEPVTEVVLNTLTSALESASDPNSVDWNQLVWDYGWDDAVRHLNELSPITWKVSLGSSEPGRPRSEVSLDATDGELLLFNRTGPHGSAGGPSSPEESPTREIERLLSRLFSVKWTDLVIEEELAGQEGALRRYSLAALSPSLEPGLHMRYRAEMTAGRPSRISRQLVSVGEPGIPRPELPRRAPAWWRHASGATVMAVTFFLFLLTVKRALNHWKAAAVLALVMAGTDPGTLSRFRPPFSFQLAFESFSSFALFGFLVFSVVLVLTTMEFPSKLASFNAAARWSRYRFPLGLSLLRGALLGLASLGLLAGIVTPAARSGAFWVDPSLGFFVSEGLRFGGFSSLAHSINLSMRLAFIGIAIPVLVVLAGGRRRFLLAAVVTGLWTLAGSPLAIVLQPWSSNPWFFFVVGFLLTWAFVRYDLTTLLFGVFSFYLFFTGYPGLVLFKRIGAASFYAAFGMWGLLVLFGLWAYSGPSLTKTVGGWQRRLTGPAS